AGFGDGRPIRLRPDDVQLLAREVAEIEFISPEFITQSARVRRGVKAASPAVTGILPVYGYMRNIIAQAGGRFINDRDVAERRRVAVLGDELAKLLFGDDPPVGQQVFLGDTPFTVVGVMLPKLQNSSYQQRDKDRIFISATTHYALFGNRFLNNIVYRAHSSEVTKRAERRVYETMARAYKFDPLDKDALAFWDTSEWETRFGKMFVAFNIFFAIVGSFTLLVGGIGVANIMYIVVRERTREIGVRRAVGATRADIMRQFFAEALMIVTMGAMLGLLLSVGLVAALGGLPIKEFVGLLGAGERIFMVYGGETSKAFAGLGQGRRIRLVEEDLELLKGAIPDIDRGSMSYGRWGTAFQLGKTRTNAFLEGVGPDHEPMRHMEPAQGGRFINALDIA